MNSKLLRLLFLGVVVLGAAADVNGQVAQPYVTGLRGPIRTYPLPAGELLVVEGGQGRANSGRVSLVDRHARRFTVIDDLPSGFHGPSNDPSGPSAVLLSGRRLYILMGNGDVTIAGPGGIERPNPSPSSPLFSCILLVELPVGSVDLPTGFVLPRSAHETIAGGGAVYLTNADGDAARVSRIVDFVDYSPAPRPDAPDNVLISNTFAMVGTEARIDVVDAARNLIWSVPMHTATPQVLTTFPPVANTSNPLMGPPFVDPVPATIRAYRDDLLVSYLTGFPFNAGAALVRRVDRRTGAVTTVVGGLQTALDVLPVTRGRGLFYVVEYSSNFLAGAPGRLLLVEDPDRTPLVLAAGLMRPTSVSQDTRTGDLYVTEVGAGRILRVTAPQ